MKIREKYSPARHPRANKLTHYQVGDGVLVVEAEEQRAVVCNFSRVARPARRSHRVVVAILYAWKLNGIRELPEMKATANVDTMENVCTAVYYFVLWLRPFLVRAIRNCAGRTAWIIKRTRAVVHSEEPARCTRFDGILSQDTAESLQEHGQ